MPDHDEPRPDEGGQLPPPTAAVLTEPEVPPPGRPPAMAAAPAREPIRAGELTTPWRVAVVALWVGVVVALAAVWNTSVQLGLSTWWLGPRGAPRPAPVHVIPFVAPTLMCLAAFANLRRLWLLGLGAAAITAVVGVIDLWFVPGLGVIELAIAVCAALVSLASRTGTYRAAG